MNWKNMQIVIPYKPRPWQRQVHNASNRWKVIVCHRRAGKTNMAINELIKGALMTKNSRFAYIAPFFVQAKSIWWDMLKKYSQVIPDVKFNESELRVDYPNGSRVTLYWADNPDRLRWIALWWVVFDEYAQQPSSIFSEIIRPALSDNKWWAIWIGTPKGQNAFYELFKYAENQLDWFTMELKASESAIIDDEELKDARRTMTEDEYNQEYECSWSAAIKWAYYSKELAECREKRILRWLYETTLPTYTAWDLGISDYMAVTFFQAYQWEIRIIDYYEDNGKSLEYFAKVINDKQYRYDQHYFPHDIQVRELTTGTSRFEAVQRLFNNKCTVLPMTKIMDGINNARVNFQRVWFDENNTSVLRNSLANYSQEWDDKKWVFKDNPRHDWASHGADSFRYAMQAYNSLQIQWDFESFQVSYELY